MRPTLKMTSGVMIFLLMIYTFRAPLRMIPLAGTGGMGMVFRVLKGCRRTAPEQRFIYSVLEMWNTLPEAKREEIRALIGRLSATPVEGRALYDVLVRRRAS